MSPKRIFELATLLGIVLILVVVSVTVALADGPRPNGLPWSTTVPWPTPRPLAVGERWSPSNHSAPVAPSAPIDISPPNPAPQPIVVSPLPDLFRGTDPSSHLIADGGLRTLNSGSKVWNRIGTRGVSMDVYLYANPHANVNMAVYAPHQLHKPIGNGTPYKGDPPNSFGRVGIGS